MSATLEKFRMSECNTSPTPTTIARLTKKLEEESFPKEKLFRELVGTLVYASVCSIPETMYAVSSCSQHLKAPGEEHWQAAKKILRYMKENTFSITYKQSAGLTLSCYCDSDWSGDQDDRKSTTGYVLYLAGAPVSWKSRKQRTPCLSSSEAEYIAASEAAQEIVHLRTLLYEMGVKQELPTPLYCDNQSCISLAKNPIQHSRVKHIDTRFHFIRRMVKRGSIAPIWISSKNNPADIFTKPLGPILFRKCANLLHNPGMVSVTDPEC